MLFPNTIRGTIETGKCTIADFSSTEWYSIVMNAISKYHSGIIATGKCTIEDVSGTNCTEWYSIVMNGISKYHSGIIETGKFTIEDVSCTEWYFQIPLIRVALRPAGVYH